MYRLSDYPSFLDRTRRIKCGDGCDSKLTANLPDVAILDGFDPIDVHSGRSDLVRGIGLRSRRIDVLSRSTRTADQKTRIAIRTAAIGSISTELMKRW